MGFVYAVEHTGGLISPSFVAPFLFPNLHLYNVQCEAQRTLRRVRAESGPAGRRPDALLLAHTVRIVQKKGGGIGEKRRLVGTSSRGEVKERKEEKKN